MQALLQGESNDSTPSAAPAASSLKSRLDPYMAIIGPLAMILMILAFMAVMEPTRYFRLSDLNQMSVDEINALEQEAFRFSGVGALKR